MSRLDIVNNLLCENHVIFLFKGEIHYGLEDMRLTEGQKLGYFTMEEFRILKFPDFLKPICLSVLYEGN